MQEIVQLPSLEEFSKIFAQQSNSEEKIRYALDFMQKCLEQDKGIALREFWAARKEILPEFKSELSVKSRSKLWQEMIELVQRARRLKEILDEESSFACEQIELAASALQKDLENFEEISSQSSTEISQENDELIARGDLYVNFSKQLHLLEVLSERFHGLKEEILTRSMRLGVKNQLFTRLAHLGDLLFPRKRALLQKISEELSSDVDAFLKTTFPIKNRKKAVLLGVRAKIQAYQALAKEILSPSTFFQEIRQKLSHSWEELKKAEQQQREQDLQKREGEKLQVEAITKEIEKLQQFCESKDATIPEVEEMTEALVSKLQLLHRDTSKALKMQIEQITQPIYDRRQEQHQKQKQQELSVQEEKQQKLDDLKVSIIKAVDSTEESVEQLHDLYGQFFAQISKLEFIKGQEFDFSLLMLQLREKILQKQGAGISADFSGEQQLSSLRMLFEERKKQRIEIKHLLESIRKAAGASGQNLMDAMAQRAHIDGTKALLEFSESALVEVEEKIFDLET